MAHKQRWKKTEEEEYKYVINRARAMIQLDHIKTYEQALKALGITDHELSTSKDPISIQGFNLLVEDLKAKQKEKNETIIDTEIPAAEVSAWQTYKYPAKNPKQKAVLYPPQLGCAKRMFYDIVERGHTGLLLNQDVGYGKTYVFGQVLRWLHDSGWVAKHTMSPWPTAVISKASLIRQTKRVLKNEFGLDLINEVLVINIDAMRSGYGKMFITSRIIHREGDPEEILEWKPHVNPCVVVLDECQTTKNDGSKQSRCIQAYNDISSHRVLIASSATPFSTIAQAKVFCVATKHKVQIGFTKVELNNQNWEIFAKKIATDQEPKMFSGAALKRLLREFRPYIYSFKLKFDYKSTNSTRAIQFPNEDFRKQYIEAWNEYREASIRAKNRDPEEGGGNMMQLAMLNIFRGKAEALRYINLAQLINHDVQEGYSVICACAFKPTIAKTVIELCNTFKYKRDDISLIWGGDTSFVSQEEKYSIQEIHEILRKGLAGEKIPKKVLNAITRQIMNERHDLGEVPPDMRLGPQSIDNRDDEIDRFQTGKSSICMFTFAAGGAGLSLHHFRGERNGGPRRVYATPIYNEMEAHQAFGRGHRINSISPTHQTVILFDKTVEVAVLHTLLAKKNVMDIVTKLEAPDYDSMAQDIVSKQGMLDEDHETDTRDIFGEDKE